MIHNDVLSQLQLLVKTSAPPLLEISQQELELPQLVPGQKVPAHVIASLPNGRFEVLIADKTLDMNLPRNTQAGDTLELVFVSPKPRLTFVLASDLSAVAKPLDPGTTKSPVTLSETARFLGGLLEKTLPGQADKLDAGKLNPRGEAVSTLAKSAPVSAGLPADIPKFAQALREAVSQSGLFYESHQAQWVSGQRLTAELFSEPQGRLSPAMQGQNGMVEHRALSTPLPGGATSHMTEPLSAQIQSQTPSSASSLQDSMGAKPLQPAHPDTLPIVRQQIEALDSRQILWQGQVWPGQSMDWTIEERAAREQGSSDAQANWQTQLHLVMPQLGEIGARLALHPTGLRLQLDAPDEATAKLFAREAPSLQQALESAGLSLIEMNIHRTDEQARQK